MTDAEELRDILKMYGARWQGSERATVRRIADRLEKIDAPKRTEFKPYTIDDWRYGG